MKHRVYVRILVFLLVEHLQSFAPNEGAILLAGVFNFLQRKRVFFLWLLLKLLETVHKFAGTLETRSSTARVLLLWRRLPALVYSSWFIFWY